MMNKLVLFLGIKTVDHDVHHKNYLNKFMVLSSSYCIFINNDVEKGVHGFRGLLERAGEMVVQKETTYKRFTDADDNILYPKIAGNESRIAGREYFHPLEVTGATKKTKNGSSKYSLMHDWWPRQIDHLEQLSRQLIQQYGVDILS